MTTLTTLTTLKEPTLTGPRQPTITTPYPNPHQGGDAPLVSGVLNCSGCEIEYDPETGAATILYCADHDADDHRRELEEAEKEARQLYASLRRLTDGMHTGDYDDAHAALTEASALIGRLAPLYHVDGERP